MRAVADTGPLHYLVLIGHVEIVSKLFSEIAAPDVVRDELAHPGAPIAVRNWAAKPPAWLSIKPAMPHLLGQVDSTLDNGERAAIALAIERRPDLVLMDDRSGIAAARAHAFAVTGTLGLLVRAARRGLLDPSGALDALGRTSFRWTPVLRARVQDMASKEAGRRRQDDTRV